MKIFSLSLLKLMGLSLVLAACNEVESGADSSLTQSNSAIAGPQGAVGPQGPVGATGPAGPQGERGPAGANGVTSIGQFTKVFETTTLLNPGQSVTWQNDTGKVIFFSLGVQLSLSIPTASSAQTDAKVWGDLFLKSSATDPEILFQAFYMSMTDGFVCQEENDCALIKREKTSFMLPPGGQFRLVSRDTNKPASEKLRYVSDSGYFTLQ